MCQIMVPIKKTSYIIICTVSYISRLNFLPFPHFSGIFLLSGRMLFVKAPFRRQNLSIVRMRDDFVELFTPFCGGCHFEDVAKVALLNTERYNNVLSYVKRITYWIASERTCTCKIKESSVCCAILFAIVLNWIDVVYHIWYQTDGYDL